MDKAGSPIANRVQFKITESLRGCSDEELLNDLRRSASEIGRDTITMTEYGRVGRGHPSTIQKRFGSWPKALELAGLRPSRSPIGIREDELLEDIRRSASEAGQSTITQTQYGRIGKCGANTVQRRFGSWQTALKLAGLNPSMSQYRIPDEDLFENLRAVWTSLGRQPTYSEMTEPSSAYSAKTYEQRFGSWSKALKAFVDWVNSDAEPARSVEADDPRGHSHKPQIKACERRTKKHISERQRFRILQRDSVACKTCGASPAKQAGVELHVDHIVPWSKGGETTDDNLQTKCSRCNLGKGNAFDR